MKKLLIIGILTSLSAFTAVQAQHINAGALDSNGDSALDKLYFVNGSGYASSSGYIFNATWRTTGTYAGFYDLAPSFTALAAFNHSTPEATTASPFAVAGSFLKLQIVSVSGPGSGTFSYWAVGSTTPTFSLQSGNAAAGNEIWDLTSNLAWTDGTPASGAAGFPGSDPYGHIHGQRFTVDLPGTYIIGLQLVDAAATHLTPSDTFYITVAAVPEPATYALFALGALVLAGMSAAKQRSLAKAGGIALIVGISSPAFAHIHINAGVQDINNNGIADPGEKLYFTNGSFYQAGTVNWGLTFRLPGEDYQGFYISNVPPPSDSGFSFTVQPATLMNGGPAFNHPAPGSFIQLRIVSVTGPGGGHFSWWDEEDTLSPTATFASGLTNGIFQYDLSEGANLVDSDPYGHVHGRTFGVDLPGLYTVGFQLVDISTFGPGGGPLAAASDIYYMNFSAIPEPASWALLMGGCLLTGLMAKRRLLIAQYQVPGKHIE